MEGQTIKKKTEPEDVIAEANEAKHRALIASTKIKEERAKQEEIKTAEIKKELAPIDMLVYYFSFIENILQRLYTAPHELTPQLSALYMAGENKKAEQLLLRKLEGIVKDVHGDLLKTIKSDGYKYKNEV